MISNLYLLVNSQHLLRIFHTAYSYFPSCKKRLYHRFRASRFDLRDFHPPHWLRPYSYCHNLLFRGGYFRIVVEVDYNLLISYKSKVKIGFQHLKKFVHVFGAISFTRADTCNMRTGVCKLLLESIILYISIKSRLYLYLLY